MSVLFGYHRSFIDHDPGIGHPEAALRLDAAREGLSLVRATSELIEFSRVERRDKLLRVHPNEHVELIDRLSRSGRAMIDADTWVSQRSFIAARHAAGAGLDAVERLDRGQADAAFLALRPPGHHASRGRARGFCLFNSLAVTAAALVERGERVLVLDWDAHHGNGTQEIFYDQPEVLFVSFHQAGIYPGTGAVSEVGSGAGLGTTINVPFPARTTGDAYRLAFDELVFPVAEEFSPTWLLVSAGFDAHHRDPLTDLGLSSADFADLASLATSLCPPGRRIFFLEGGYDYQAIVESTAATLAALDGGRFRPSGPLTDSASLSLYDARSPASIVQRARHNVEAARHGV